MTGQVGRRFSSAIGASPFGELRCSCRCSSMSPERPGEPGAYKAFKADREPNVSERAGDSTEVSRRRLGRGLKREIDACGRPEWESTRLTTRHLGLGRGRASRWLVEEAEVGPRSRSCRRHRIWQAGGYACARAARRHWARRECDSRHHGGPESYSQLPSRLTRFRKSLLSRGASEPRRTEENE